MKFRYTKHAVYKFLKLQQSGFHITRLKIQNTIKSPLKLETRIDNNLIATSLIDDLHVLRVVYRTEDDIIVIITFYPGRRKAYEI